MPPPLQITSPHNPRIAAVCALRKHRERDATGLFIAEGRREVPRAIAAGLRVVELWHCPDLIPADDPDLIFVRQHLGDSVPWYQTTPSVFKKIAYLEDPHGLIAVVEQPRWTLDSLSNRQSTIGNRQSHPLFLIAVGLAKPGNLGAMARTAAAAGASALFVADGVVDAFNPNAVRASTGAVFTLPIVGGTSAQIIDWLRAQDVAIVAAALDGRDLFADRVNLTGRLAIAVGAEDTGLSPIWLQSDIGRVRIPMTARYNTHSGGCSPDSLNAAAAAAVLLFEAVRQRSCLLSDRNQPSSA